MNRIIQILLYISDMLVPFLILYVVAHGLLARRPVYDDFVKGAKDGFQTVLQIMPTLVGLMVAVGVLRASGFLDFLSETLGRMTELVHFPSELVPLTIVRMFSASAATGLALDIFKEYGTDSYLGLTASILMGCTETIFYTMSVYFMTAKVKKTRYTLTGALLATLVGGGGQYLAGRNDEIGGAADGKSSVCCPACFGPAHSAQMYFSLFPSSRKDNPGSQRRERVRWKE